MNTENKKTKNEGEDAASPYLKQRAKRPRKMYVKETYRKEGVRQRIGSEEPENPTDR